MQFIGDIRFIKMPYKDLELRKLKHKEYSKKHYEKNTKQIKQRVKDYKIIEKTKWYLFKETLKCTNCGFSHKAAMDFHHEDPSTKIDSVHRLINSGKFAMAYEEMKKCIVLCSNCHRIHHHDERLNKKRKQKKKSLLSKKSNSDDKHP